MARINRFYLFIAALVMSKTYDASAAKFTIYECNNIKGACHSIMSQCAEDPECNLDNTEYNDPMDGICVSLGYAHATTNFSNCMAVCAQALSSTLDPTYCDVGSSGGGGGGGGGSGGGAEPDYVPPSCISGQYWDLWGAPGLGADGGAGSCTTCPTYNYASGKYFSDLASSSQRNTDTSAAGSGGNVQFCYVPRGNVFTDNSGTFQYVNDCYYYGS